MNKKILALGLSAVLSVSVIGSAFADELTHDKEVKNEILKCVNSKNIHSIPRICESSGIDPRKATDLTELIGLYGPPAKVIPALRELCKWKGVEIIEGNMMPDHVHILVSIPPKYSVSQFMGYLKGKSAMMIFERHANLKYKFGNRNFWATGYYVSTVGLNEATVRKYIQEQEKDDIARDKLSVKEYEDPFGEDTENRKKNK